MFSLKKLVLFSFTLMAAGVSAAQIRLSADFDTGNLDDSYRIDSTKLMLAATDSITVYQLSLNSRIDPPNPIDTAVQPSSRWFHFRMEGVKNKPLFIHISNSEVNRPFFSYDGENYQRFEVRENLLPHTINTVFERDTVYVAYFAPYTHKRHCEDMHRWCRSPYAHCDTIGYSTNGLPITMLTVTDPASPDHNKKKIWLHARVHTSEAPASWHLASLIDQLLDSSELCAAIRRNAVFYIVPEPNPDGVLGGYSRSTPSGVNMEINWDRHDSLTAPEVLALKRTIERLAADRPFDIALNLHSQIKPSVTYWIHTAESTSPYFLHCQMLLSAHTITHTPYYCREDQCFSTLNTKFPEGWFWEMYGDRTLALTFETTYSCYNNDPCGETVTFGNLAQLAQASLLTLSDMLDLGGAQRMVSDSENIPLRSGWTQKSDDRIFFGGSYLVSERANASVTFAFDAAEAGIYDVYKWNPGSPDPDDDDECLWIHIDEIANKKAGPLTWTYTATAAGEILDAILLVRRP